ncbi:MAG TPA: phosphoglucosamine mutase [Thermoplasmata archaeon]|nr:phosphoglucosamine mutase [Thermoplasmata archaeon]
MSGGPVAARPQLGGTPPRLFGTDGIRKVVGTDLNPAFVSAVASAVAEHLHHHGTVLIAQDFRTTSPGIARILAGTLQMAGVDVVEMGAMPTPALQFNVRALAADLGLMVTASHNPTEFNGIKFSGPVGLELTRGEEVELERLLFEGRPSPIRWDRAGSIHADSSGVDRYLASIRKNVEADRIRSFAPRVVLDCGNGTSAATSPRLLVELGCRLTTLNANPDGRFPGHPSEPTAENLVDLSRAVVASGGVLGVAHDGDADRVAFIDETGRYIPGEETLALFADDVLARQPNATIVTSVTSSSCIDEVVRARGGRLVVTRSGSLPVAEGITSSGAAFGGEENGGYYSPAHQVARDGPMSSARMLELLARTGEPLSQLVARLPQFRLVKTKVPLPPEFRPIVMAEVEEEMGARATRLLTLDGVKAYFADGWLLVRPSGTEPICRIFSESRELTRAQALNQLGAGLVTSLVRAHTDGAKPS